ncbi:MAG: UDP-3-O-(3-hydroxymyristoyl)glucosamine N-acyltransferase [Christensenella sp.]|nr:UDP-3-O-(3-hydroxymyristoyl)glucosamine N-acyltransferase [Christensenella sp.]
MKLSEFFDAKEIKNDVEFDCIGLLMHHPGKRMLVFFEDEKYLPELIANADATAVICTPETVEAVNKLGHGIVISAKPRKEITLLHNQLCNDERYIGQNFDTMIGKNCKISPDAYIAPQNVVIGDHTIIGEKAVIKSGTVIGKNCFIHAGCVIGGCGFEFKRIDGIPQKVIHRGKVTLGDRVEILQMSSIMRAVYPWDSTAIGSDTKISSMVSISHAVKIGERTMVSACSCIAGSAQIGSDVWVGVNSTISDRIVVGDRARVSLGAVVTKNVPENATVSGNFAIDHQKFLKHIKQLAK